MNTRRIEYGPLVRLLGSSQPRISTEEEDGKKERESSRSSTLDRDS